MIETSYDYCVAWEFLFHDEWRAKTETYDRRDHAELQYDTIIDLEKKFGTPRNARLLKRTRTISDWEQVERHA